MLPDVEHVVIPHDGKPLVRRPLPVRLGPGATASRVSSATEARSTTTPRRTVATSCPSPCRTPRSRWIRRSVRTGTPRTSAGTTAPTWASPKTVVRPPWDTSLERQLPFYYSLASHFPIGDRFFSSVMAQTYPNRRFLAPSRATALGDVATETPLTSRRKRTHPTGRSSTGLYPYDITWRDYYPDLPTAALFLPEFSDKHAQSADSGPDQPVPRRCRRRLAALGFSLVDPYTDYSEEDGDISIGEAYAARIISAVMSSPNWAKTVMFLVYDEHGG